MRAILTILLLGAILLPSSLVSAQDQEMERAIELFENGAILYDEGQYEQAVSAWEESYRISGEPLILYNMANAHERLNHLEHALELYNEYRAYATSDERETLERRIRNLERRVEENLVEQEQEDQQDREREQELQARELEAQQLTEELEQQELQLQESRIPLPLSFQIMRYGSAGFAVIGLGMGAMFGSQAAGHHSDLDDMCPNGICLDTAQDTMDDEKSSALLADVSFLFAGTAAVVFVSSFLFEPDRTRTTVVDSEVEASISILPFFGSNSAGLSIGGRF